MKKIILTLVALNLLFTLVFACFVTFNEHYSWNEVNNVLSDMKSGYWHKCTAASIGQVKDFSYDPSLRLTFSAPFFVYLTLYSWFTIPALGICAGLTRLFVRFMAKREMAAHLQNS
jgi:hypothetical protein